MISTPRKVAKGKEIKYRKKLHLVLLTIFVLLIISIGLATYYLIAQLEVHDLVVKKPVPRETAADFDKPGTSHEKNKLGALKLPIITYHFIEDVAAEPALEERRKLAIGPGNLEVEIQTLQKNDYQMGFVGEIPAIVNRDTPYNPKMVFLTFDDGFADFYPNVLPLLKKYNVKATLYVVYNFINKNDYLNEKQIKEIINSGLVEIGSHTLDHVFLKTSTGSAKKQILDSKQKLQDKFGININSFAYPYGSFNDYDISLVKEAGYTSAVSTLSGSYQTTDNLFYLSRLRAGVFGGNTIVKTLENLKK